LRTEARIGRSAASVASFHRPRQPGVIRPIGSTAVASMQNIAAPDSASVLMWVKCQSLASPFTAEYWHIGATMMRFASERPRSLIGENRTLIGDIRARGVELKLAIYSRSARRGRCPRGGVSRPRCPGSDVRMILRPPVYERQTRRTPAKYGLEGGFGSDIRWLEVAANL
jgi:hypothetical protein